MSSPRKNANSRGGEAGRGRKRQVNVNENSPVIKAFRIYQNTLDSKHDRYERIVKLSRDITIESKRAIFLLQRCAGEASEEKEKVLQEAQSKLKEIQTARFLPVAVELDGQDHYQFIRAYSPGLQEYIEAISFYRYLSSGQLITLPEVEIDLVFRRPASTVAEPVTAGGECKNTGTAVSSNTGTAVSSTSTVAAADSQAAEKEGSNRPSPLTSEVSSTSETKTDIRQQNYRSAGLGDKVFVTVPPVEFMLGIADLTGELMRTAIMSVSAGNLDYPVKICDFMRIIHDSFMSYGNTARELCRKMATLRQSLQKVEGACYTLKVRGSEIPKHMLADIFSSDEAFVEDADNSVYD